MIPSIALLALAGAALAAESVTTVDIVMLFAGEQPLVASVIGVDSAATTYAIGCPSGLDDEMCGLQTSQTITQGPSTYAFTIAFTPTYDDDDGPYTGIAACQLNSKIHSGSCTISMISTEDGVLETRVNDAQSFNLDTFPSPFPVTITAGAEKLTAAPGATSTATASTSASASASAASSPSASSPSASSSFPTTSFSSATATSEATASSSSNSTTTTTHATAAGSINTQNIILAGVAALAGAVMVL